MKDKFQAFRQWRRSASGLSHAAVTALLFLLLTLILELTLFNYKFYMTAGQTPVQVNEFISASDLEALTDSTFRVTGTDPALEAEFPGVHLSSLHLDVYRENAGGTDQLETGVTLSVTDAANATYMKLPERTVLPFVSKSQYMTLHLSGETGRIKLEFDADRNDVITIQDMTLNPVIPRRISPLRLLLFTAALTVLYYIRPMARFFRSPYNPSSSRQGALISAAMVLQILLFAAAVCMNPWFLNPPSSHHYQYHDLAVALSEGHPWLDEEPSEALQQMENPYDTGLREEVMDETGQTYLFDRAYYEGKYYVYFGVVPVLVFYLPWYLLTGSAFPTFLGILTTGIVFIFAVYWFMQLLMKKFASAKIPFISWLLLTTLFINSCGVLAIMRRPDFYSLPILMGVTFSMLGICCFISSIKPDRISKGKIFLGCLCMALVVGCRPQLALGSFFIFPIYWDAVFKKRLLFSKKGLAPTLLAILPYVLVLSGLMYYNYIRFGSPFDFGANYNLTTNDMTKRGIVLGRLPIGIFTYLFQPPVITAQFPFINRAALQTAYMGRTISEATFGGFFAVNLISWPALFIFRARKWFSDKKLWAIGVMGLLFALLIICVDTEGAGILLRYYSDFGWLLLLPAVLVYLTAAARFADRPAVSAGLRYFLAVAFISGMAFHLMLMFTDGGVKLQDTNPELFYYFYYHLQFWQ